MPRIPTHVIDQKAAARRIIPGSDDRGVRPWKPVCTEQILYDHRPVREIIIMRQLHRKRQPGKHRRPNAEAEMDQVRPRNADLSTKQKHEEAGRAGQTTCQNEIRRLRQNIRQSSQIQDQPCTGHTDHRHEPAPDPCKPVQKKRISPERQNNPDQFHDFISLFRLSGSRLFIFRSISS